MVVASRSSAAGRRTTAKRIAVGLAIGLYLGFGWGFLRAWLGPALGATIWGGIPFLAFCYSTLRKQEAPRLLAFAVAAAFTALVGGIVWLFAQ